MMKNGRKVLLAFLGLFILLSPGVPCYADDAEVLPKGIFRGSVSGVFWFSIDERYGPDGDTEDIASDFNARLDSGIFPDLSLLEVPSGPLPAGSANIGTSEVSMEINLTDVVMDFAYGVTDKLSIGIVIPYWYQEQQVNARVDTSKATVGLNPDFGTPGDPFGIPLIPIAAGGVPLTTDDVQALLGAGLPGIPGFGYERFKTWSGNGISDIKMGLKYQYLNTNDWRLAFTGGVRIPTGAVDDPDNLADMGFGTGQYALLFRLHNDYTGIEDLVLNTTFRYDLELPDHETVRVLDDVNQPLTVNKESVRRDIGDGLEFEVSGKYTFLKTLTYSMGYTYFFKLRDSISGKRGLAYGSLEDETRQQSHIVKTGLSFSTLPWVMEKTFPVPISASVEYRNRIAGTNNFLNSQYVSLELGFYF